MDFFHYSALNNCPSDFINIHYYDNSFSVSESISDSFSISNIEKTCPLNVDPFAFTKFINQLKVQNKKLKLGNIPIYLTEWNLTVSQRDLINDTCFKSCYLTKNLLENYDRLESFGYWCLTDFMEELQVPNEQYHGGLGMFTYNGIPKAHYNTFLFLTHLGNELIAKGNGFFVTKEGSKIVIILYNYEHYSKLFASGILFDMTNENRYAPFTQMNQAQFQIKLHNLPSSGCLVKEMFVNQNHGSSYDAWAKMGFPSLIRPEDLESLKQVSQPGLYLHHEAVNQGELFLTAELEPLEVRMMEIILD
jgi:xylan 1,4-beta-xylosidase